MAIQTRLVGTLGGARVNVTPGLSASNPNNTTATLATVSVPAGETWLVTVVGTMSTGGSGANTPRLGIGGVESQIMSGPAAMAEAVTGTVPVSLRTTNASAVFNGTLYTVKL